MSGCRSVVGMAVGILTLFIAGCDKQWDYKPVQFQGKTDNRPWDNNQFKGDQTEWEKTVKARSQNQSQFSRQ